MHTPHFHRIFVTTALFAAAITALPNSTLAQTPTLTKLHDFNTLDGSYPTNGLLCPATRRAEVFEFDVRSGGTPATCLVSKTKNEKHPPK